VASARSLRDALRLACDQGFQTGRLMGLLGAAGLRLSRRDADAQSIAGGWCRTVLAMGGSNVDVRGAVPDIPARFLDAEAHAAPENRLTLRWPRPCNFSKRSLNRQRRATMRAQMPDAAALAHFCARNTKTSDRGPRNLWR